MPSPIRALIFDFDGLIFDTETTEMIVWKRIYAGYGCEFPEERWAQNAGLWNSNHRWDPAAHLQALAGRALDLDALNRQHHDESATAFETQPAERGVVETLDAAQRLGLRRAVASSSPLYWVKGHLTRLGLVARFERIISGDDVAPERVKPQPDIYLKALEALGLDAGQALAFEDSPHGVRAARAAGICVVAVPNPTTFRLKLDEADLVIDSFAALPLEQLLQRVSERALQS
jgi:HAD superfamily hydrolase (TIGR01509 family)